MRPYYNRDRLAYKSRCLGGILTRCGFWPIGSGSGGFEHDCRFLSQNSLRLMYNSIPTTHPYFLRRFLWLTFERHAEIALISVSESAYFM